MSMRPRRVHFDQDRAVAPDPSLREVELSHGVRPDEAARVDDDAQGDERILEHLDEGGAGEVCGEIDPDLRHHRHPVRDAAGDREVQPLGGCQPSRRRLKSAIGHAHHGRASHNRGYTHASIPKVY
jgi:hypothetical protein